MTGILDRVSHSNKQFYPSTYLEYFALQLASKLSDERHISFYLSISEKHHPDSLLRIYRSISKIKTDKLPEAFYEQYKIQLTNNGNVLI